MATRMATKSATKTAPLRARTYRRTATPSFGTDRPRDTYDGTDDWIDAVTRTYVGGRGGTADEWLISAGLLPRVAEPFRKVDLVDPRGGDLQRVIRLAGGVDAHLRNEVRSTGRVIRRGVEG
jgi:hypothetical protein